MPYESPAERVLRVLNEDLLKECRAAFLALTSADASKNFLITRKVRREYGYTPQEAVAHYMVEFLEEEK